MHRIRKLLSIAAVLAAAMLVVLFPDSAQARKKGVLEGEPIVRRKLQLRRLRFQITPAVAMSLSQPFVHKGYAGGKLGFHFTEWLGLRAGFFYGAVRVDSALLKDLTAPPEEGGLPRGVEPGGTDDRMRECNIGAPCRRTADLDNPAVLAHDFRAGLTQAQWQSSVDVVFTPFVGKLGLFSAIFTEYDIYVFGGLGLMGWEKRFENQQSTAQQANLDTDPDSPEYCQVSLEGGGQRTVNDCILHPVKADDGLHLGFSFGGGLHLFLTDWMAMNLEIQDIITRNNLTGLNATLTETRPVVNNKDKDLFHNVTLQLGLKIYIPFRAKRTQ